MKTISVTLTGIAPLMMHNERLSNPCDALTAELRALTTQKKKTDDLLSQIAKKEWVAGLYESDGQPAVPADNVIACLKEGARKRKLGKQIEAGVFSQARAFPLDYDGPKEIEALWDDGRFFDYRSVSVNQRRTMRARPRFDEWSVKVTLTFDPDLISEADLIDSLQVAGMQVGLCEKRPQFGRFTVQKEV